MAPVVGRTASSSAPSLMRTCFWTLICGDLMPSACAGDAGKHRTSHTSHDPCVLRPHSAYSPRARAERSSAMFLCLQHEFWSQELSGQSAACQGAFEATRSGMGVIGAAALPALPLLALPGFHGPASAMPGRVRYSRHVPAAQHGAVGALSAVASDTPSTTSTSVHWLSLVSAIHLLPPHPASRWSVRLGAVAPTSPAQRAALVELYIATNGSTWSSGKTGWQNHATGSDPCDSGWSGVSCSGSTGSANRSV